MNGGTAYKNAPISEAVFDIHVRLAKVIPTDRLREIPDELRKSYPLERKRVGLQGTLKFEGENQPVSTANSTLLGYIFSNKSGNQLFQFRSDGFSFNMLKPYSNWNLFSTEAFRLWLFYKKLVGDYQVERLGLRYINRIGLPLPLASVEDYFTYVPPIPASLPPILSRFFMQVQIPMENGIGHVILTETVDQIDKQKNELPFLLDIDCVYPISSSISDSEMKSIFGELRNLKNQIFESCINDSTRALFN